MIRREYSLVHLCRAARVLVFTVLVAGSLPWTVQPAAAQGAASATTLPIRLSSGLMFEVPEGWHWTDIYGGFRVTFAPDGETQRGRADPDEFDIVALTEPRSSDPLAGDWPRVERQGSRNFPNGASVRWRAGQQWGGEVHANLYSFEAEIRFGGKVLEVSKSNAGSLAKNFSAVRIEEALLGVARSLSLGRASEAMYHPVLSMASMRLDGWWHSQASPMNFNYSCAKSACGADFRIYVYPSSNAFTDLAAALTDITAHFEQNLNLRIGPVQQESFGGAEIAWTEQPGSQYFFWPW